MVFTKVETSVETPHTLLTAPMGESATYIDTVHDEYMDSACENEILPVDAPPNELGLADSAVPITPISMCELLSTSQRIEAQCCDLLDGANYINAQCCSC